ncbi:MAG: hypothetical protein ACT4PT_04660 [Methanobacteriota archaeon]
MSGYRMRAAWFGIALVVAGLFAAAPPASSGGTGPSPRHDAGFVFSGETGAFVLYGGVAAGVPVYDTWTWDGHWRRIESSPSPALEPGFAFAEDPRTETVMLAGRRAGAFETWEFAAGGWRLLSSQTAAPPLLAEARSFAVTASHPGQPQEREMILVTGEPGLGTETWTWTGTAWADPSLSPYPSGREGFGLQFYWPEAMLFGGIDPETGARSDDTAGRYFDSDLWHPMPSSPRPSPVSFPSMAPPFRFGGPLLFGGETDQGVTAQTWWWGPVFPSGGWTRLFPEHSPPPRAHAAMAGNVDGTSAVLFGGVGADGQDRNDLWSFHAVCDRRTRTCPLDWTREWAGSSR